jgi:hypothetical protein
MKNTPKLRFNSKEAITSEQVAKRTAFAKKEIPLIEKAMRVSSTTKSRGMLIGGAAMRFYMDKKHGGNVGHVTDVDFAFEEIPSDVKKKMGEEKLILKTLEKTGSTMGWTASCKPMKVEIRSEHTVFHIKDELRGEFPDLYDVCFFEGKIGKIPVKAEDISMANSVAVSDAAGKVIELKVADPGFLLATVLNGQAVTAKRAVRAAYVIASNQGEMEEVATRYAEVMGRKGITNEEVARALEVLGKNTKRAVSGAVNEFIKKAKEKMGM